MDILIPRRLSSFWIATGQAKLVPISHHNIQCLGGNKIVEKGSSSRNMRLLHSNFFRIVEYGNPDLIKPYIPPLEWILVKLHLIYVFWKTCAIYNFIFIVSSILGINSGDRDLLYIKRNIHTF